MFVLMYTLIYILIYILMYIFMSINSCLYVWIHVYINVCIFMSIYLCLYVCIYSCLYIYVYMLILMYICLYTCVSRGKFGQVFKLVEKATRKTWAGKFIKAFSAKEKENVRQEILIMNSLHHPKLVQCIDAFEGKSDIVMVLEMYVSCYTQSWPSLYAN